MTTFNEFIDAALKRGLDSAKPFCLKAMATSDGPVGSLEDCLQSLTLDCASEMNMEIEAIAKVVDQHSGELVAVRDIDGETIGWMTSEFAT